MINLVTTYQEKYSIFECGFHSFLGQNRTQFGVKFFIFALVYLLLDLEIILIFPFAVSGYVNDIYGLSFVLFFTAIITIGFIYELGKSALKIDSRQIITPLKEKSPHITESVNLNKFRSSAPKPLPFLSIPLQSQIIRKMSKSKIILP
jgi:NADH-ubiquinone oxidoreductase chain 3